MGRRYLTAKEAAQYIGRSLKALYHLVERGKITAHRPDGRLAFDVLELDRFMKCEAELWAS